MEISPGSIVLCLTLFLSSLIIAVLYDKSPTFRYRLKFAIYIGYLQLVALFTIPFCALRPYDVRNILISVPFLRPVNRLLGIKWEISGAEILAKDFSCVVVCNHQSMLDVLGIIQVWPIMKKCACIAKKEVFYVFPIGFMAWLSGTVYINRRNSSQSQATLSTSAEKIKQNKTKLWIFPEGTRSKVGEILPFKKGAFHIAMSSKLPIVPVVFSPYSFIDDEKKTFDSGIMKIKILDPIDTSNLQYPQDVSKLTEECYSLMSSEFKKMRDEMQPPTSSPKLMNGNCDVNGVANGKNKNFNGDPSEADNVSFNERARTS